MKPTIERLEVSAYTIPTDKPESDGTLEWNETTMVLVRVKSGDQEGIGYTYGHPSIVAFICSALKSLVSGRDALDVAGAHAAMFGKIRNNGQCGLAMMGVSAVDIGLWDLKAKILGLPLCQLLGMERDSMPVYGSGGFTSYNDSELGNQLGGWVGQGIKAVKMKVGRAPDDDQRRAKVARNAIGNSAELFVDANGAYSVAQSVKAAAEFATHGVSWLEEPVVATEVRDLQRIRERMPPGIRVVAGEYGYRLSDFRELLTVGAVDVLQADATRCGGITGFLQAGNLAHAFRVPFSSHCAPSVHLHPVLALPAFEVAEYFHDHVRIEQMFFESGATLRDGAILPDTTAPGLGLVFRGKEVTKYRVA